MSGEDMQYMNSIKIWKRILSGEELSAGMLLQHLLTQSKGIILLDGPSGCGKTTCLKNLKSVSARQVQILSYRDITDAMVRTNGDCKWHLRELSRSNCIICIEDVDYLSGREATQALLAEMILAAAEKYLIVLTGSMAQKKVPVLCQTCDLTSERAQIFRSAQKNN